MHLGKGTWFLLVIVILLLEFKSNARADGAIQADYFQTATIFGVSVSYPLPDWVDFSSRVAIAEQVSIEEQKSSQGFVRHQFPRVSGDTYFSQALSVRVFPVGPKVEELGDWIVFKLLHQDFEAICAEKLHSVGPRVPKNTSVFWCPKVVDGVIVLETESVGQIAVARWFAKHNVIVQVIHSWNGNQFEYLKEETWPATQQQIDHMIKELKSISVDPGYVAPNLPLAS